MLKSASLIRDGTCRDTDGNVLCDLERTVYIGIGQHDGKFFITVSSDKVLRVSAAIAQ
jgi:hypothetical protein